MTTSPQPSPPAAGQFTPVTGPSAWRPADFAGDEYIVRLAPRQVDEIEAVAERLVAAGGAVAAIGPADVALPETAALLAECAARLDHGPGFVTIRGLQPQNYSPSMAAAAFYALGLHFGEPMAQNIEGDVLTHIIAIADRAAYNTEVPASKTTGALVFHSDSADVVSLFCIRPAREGGASRIACAATIYNEVLERRPELLPVLFAPFHFDWRLQDHNSPTLTYASPIFGIADGVLSMYGGSKIVFTAQEYDHVPRLTELQVEALELVDTLAASPDIALDMDFQPGDIQWLLNHSALHSRTGYRDHDDPALRRHLLRLWLRRSGRPLVEPFGKPIDALRGGPIERPTFDDLVVVPDRLPVSY